MNNPFTKPPGKPGRKADDKNFPMKPGRKMPMKPGRKAMPMKPGS